MTTHYLTRTDNNFFVGKRLAVVPRQTHINNHILHLLLVLMCYRTNVSKYYCCIMNNVGRQRKCGGESYKALFLLFPPHSPPAQTPTPP